MFSFDDKGVCYFGGEGLRPRIMRAQNIDGPAAKLIVARARVMRQAAGRITGYALGEDQDQEARSFAEDVLMVFGDADKLWLETIAERLARGGRRPVRGHHEGCRGQPAPCPGRDGEEGPGAGPGASCGVRAGGRFRGRG